MIAFTYNGPARLLDGRDDPRLLDALVLGIALSQGYPGAEGASAHTWLYLQDPPTGPGDVVVWTWTEAPSASRHVPAPVATAPALVATRRRVRATTAA